MKQIVVFFVLLLIFSIVYAADGDIAIPRTSDGSSDITYTTTNDAEVTKDTPPDNADMLVVGGGSDTVTNDPPIVGTDSTVTTVPDGSDSATLPALGDNTDTINIPDTSDTNAPDGSTDDSTVTDTGSDSIVPDVGSSTNVDANLGTGSAGTFIPEINSDTNIPRDTTFEPDTENLPVPWRPRVFSNQLVRSFEIISNKPQIRDDEFAYIEQRIAIIKEKALLTAENIRIEKEVQVFEEEVAGVKEKKSIIRIRIRPEKVMQDFTLYEYIPKTIAAHASQIIFYDGNYDYYDVIEADPLIMWHFNVVDSDIEVLYGVNQEVNEEQIQRGFSLAVADIENEEAFSPEGFRKTIIFAGLILLGGMFIVGFTHKK